MKMIQIYDRPMCCSTGVCGPEVDPVLPKFASDLEWLKEQGHQIARFNLAQQPQAFIDSKIINEVLSTRGVDALPVVVVDGQVVSYGLYPTRDQFASWLGMKAAPRATVLPIATQGGCCGSNDCC